MEDKQGNSAVEEKNDIKNDVQDSADKQGNSSETVEEELLPEPAFRVTSEVRGTIGSYRQEISRHKEEIAKLLEQKERVYRQGYTELESRMENDLAALTERILEKETRLLELKEKMLDMPDKAQEAEELYAKVKKIHDEGKESLKNASDRVGKFLKNLDETQETLSESMDNSRKILEDSIKKSEQLSKWNGQLDAQVSEIKERIAQTESQMEILNEELKDLLIQVEEATEMKGDLTEVSQRFASAVDKKEEELGELEQALEEVKKVGQWCKEYFSDYEHKVDEIEQYAEKSEDELAKLRESAETEYMRKYLSELDELVQVYEGELKGLIRDEKDVDEKIDEKREKLKALIMDSQKTFRRLIKPVSSQEGFSETAARTREAAGRKRETITEKEAERERLVEDVRSAKSRKAARTVKHDKKKGKKK